LYGGVVGWGISAVRAVGMYLIRMLGEIGTRHYDMLTAMGVLAAGMICHNPRLAYHCGFLLSFGAVAGMGWIYPALLGALESKGERGLLKYKIIRNRLHRTVLALLQGLLRGLLASLSVTLSTLPIQLYYFYQIPVYGTLLNLIVLPLMGMLLAGGLVLIALPIVLPIALPVRWGVMGILALYEEICRLAECLPGHLWIVGCPSTGQIVGYYGLLTVAVIALQYGQRQERNSQAGRQRLFLWRRRAGLLILTAAVIFLIGRRHNGFSLTMLDVGQGDCICVRTAQGQTYLFDGGSSSRSSAGKYVLIPYLKHQGIGVIDGIFLSHGDEDHVNAIRELLTDSQGIRIETLYLP
ncbi:MAG: ComEC/Rec2 family competence protein, partial [Acetatifactor sp.]|nr:ComEC/Rec2 family competence protein [Acetatifactor sp.]